MANGLPSPHVAHAALHVAAIIDQRGSPAVDAGESYWHHATGGAFAPPDLRRGEQLLLDVELLVPVDGTLIPTTDLQELLAGSLEDALAALLERALTKTRTDLEGRADDQLERDLRDLVSDASKREELLLALGRRFSDARRRLIGDIGEELVTTAAREELIAFGRPDLARAVRRVSLLSDQLGYDVAAPRVQGAKRLLEVKATTATPTADTVLIHLSRNEADTGAALPDWFVVVCVVEDADQRQGRILGCCDAAAFSELLPADTNAAHWEQAAVELPVRSLAAGLPSPVS